MTISVDLIQQLRRMIAEPTSENYTDAVLEGYIATYALLDSNGNSPWVLDNTVIPPAQVANTAWEPTYDLNATAGQIWIEKAGAYAGKFDFSADGGNYSRSQVYKQMMDNARSYRAMRAGKTIRAHYSPKRPNDV